MRVVRRPHVLMPEDACTIRKPTLHLLTSKSRGIFLLKKCDLASDAFTVVQQFMKQWLNVFRIALAVLREV